MNNDDETYMGDVVMEKERMEKSLKFNQVCKQKKMLMHMKGKKK